MKILNLLSKNKTLYTLGAVCIALFCAISYLKGNMETLDNKFFYMKSEIQPLLTSIGDEGRQTYLKINILDYTFIATYTLFLCGAYFSFFKDMVNVLVVIPLLLAFSDLTETSIIFYLLKTFPQSNNAAELFLMLITPLKWILALSSLLIIVNGYLVNLYMKKT